MIRSGAMIFFIATLSTLQAKAADEVFASDVDQQHQEAQVNFDQLVSACARAVNRDRLCDLLVEIKQIGDDAVEAVKAFVPLGPSEYAILTAANFAVTGRLRVRSKAPYLKNWDAVVDYQARGDQSTTFGIEHQF